MNTAAGRRYEPRPAAGLTTRQHHRHALSDRTTMPECAGPGRHDCQHKTVHHPHGTVNAYVNDRCRGDACRAANARRAAHRRKLAAMRRLPRRYVDITATIRYVDALRLAGWTLPQIAQQLGLAHGRTIDNLYRQKRVTVDKAARIKALHDRLALVRPSRGDTQARRNASRAVTFAEKRGAVPAMAYDNIGDPNERPVGVAAPRRTRAADTLIAEVEHFRGYGDTDQQIAARLGIQAASLQRQLERAAA